MPRPRTPGRPGPVSTADSAIVDAVVQLGFAVQSTLARLAAAHQLSITQLRLLAILRDRTPGVLELAHHLGLEKSSVSGLIDRAQRRDLLTRAAAPADGRGVRVRLTAHGRRLAGQIEREAVAELLVLLGPLTAAERGQLARLASRVVAGER